MSPPRGSLARARIAQIAGRSWLYATILFAWAVYGYFMWAGRTSGPLPGYGAYLDFQAEGFRAGQLHMPIEPAPELLNAKDPYDRVNIRYWMLDASYYKGKYHTYWGPVPSLLQAIFKSILGIEGIIGDQYITLFSSMLGVWAGALIIERIGRRFFPEISRTLLVFAILAFAFANPNLHLATTAGTYCAAISSGQAWLVVGALAAFDAVWHGGSSARKSWLLVLAGIAWGFALGSRVSLLIAIALLVPATALASGFRSERRWLAIFKDVLLVGMPVALAGFALLFYNKLRFDNWLEFGSKLQLSAFPIFRVEAKYVPANLYSYAFRSFELSCQFPYVFQVWRPGPGVFPEGFKLPADYQILEPVIGWARAVPLSWFLPFGLLAVPRLRRGPRKHSFAWCLVAFAAMASLAGVAVLGLYGATMRYLNDITYGLVLLSILGAFGLRTHRIGKHLPKLSSALIVLLSGVSIVMGLLIGYQGYNGHFNRFNRNLDAKFVKALSVCGNATPVVPRYQPK